MKMHRSASRQGFTLVEIMIVVAVIALLAAIAVPSFMRARKRTQATKMLSELRLVDAALAQYAVEHNLTYSNWSSIPDAPDLVPYIKGNTDLANRLSQGSNDWNFGSSWEFGVGIYWVPDPEYAASVGSSEDIMIEAVVPPDFENMLAPDFWSPYRVWYGTYD